MGIDYIKLKGIIDSEPLNASRDGAEVARWINKPTLNVSVEHRVDDLGIMDLLGAADGAAFLDALEAVASTSSPIKWALRSISSEGLNLGDAQIRGMLNGLVADPSFTALDQAKLDMLLADTIELESKSLISIAQQNGFGTGLRSRHIDKARAI